MQVMCECWSEECLASVEVPADVYDWCLHVGNVFVVVDGCPQGPAPGDTLLRREVGYGLYRSAAPPVRGGEA
jgi:hypothetical protein